MMRSHPKLYFFIDEIRKEQLATEHKLKFFMLIPFSFIFDLILFLIVFDFKSLFINFFLIIIQIKKTQALPS